MTKVRDKQFHTQCQEEVYRQVGVGRFVAEEIDREARQANEADHRVDRDDADQDSQVAPRRQS